MSSSLAIILLVFICRALSYAISCKRGFNSCSESVKDVEMGVWLGVWGEQLSFGVGGGGRLLQGRRTNNARKKQSMTDQYFEPRFMVGRFNTVAVTSIC